MKHEKSENIRNASLAHAAGYQDVVPSEKEICAGRKKAAPLEPLARNAGNFDVFQGAHVEPLEPLANLMRFFDGLRFDEIAED